MALTELCRYVFTHNWVGFLHYQDGRDRKKDAKILRETMSLRVRKSNKLLIHPPARPSHRSKNEHHDDVRILTESIPSIRLNRQEDGQYRGDGPAPEASPTPKGTPVPTIHVVYQSVDRK